MWVGAMRPLEDGDENGWTVRKFQTHDGSGRSRDTEDREDRLIVRSAVTAPDSSLSTIRTQRCVDDILRTVLLLFLLQYVGLLFQPDNAKLHTIRVAMNCLTSYQALLWSSRSPDLSSIQQVWDMMGRRLHLSWNVDDFAQ
ncbi:uncharacterized protein TNCV_981111 [Trichonephila clavipes]|uniref:Uncharacterized protein n=1 Tax=Trichonephila clavipes TaxID=2585209 RepID=A0A8X6RZP1_TRICX|nr:uncharacterized protein TNCV_981111 [Trichonephila clavipes]